MCSGCAILPSVRLSRIRGGVKHHEVGVIRQVVDWNNPVQSESCLCFTWSSGVPSNFVRLGWRGRGSTNFVEDRGQRELRFGGGRPLVRGSGGSCNLVQEISFHILTFYTFLVL